MTITLVGELHQDLFFSFNYYTDFAQVLAAKIKEITQTQDLKEMSEDDINSQILNIIDDMPKKIGGKSWIGRGGNGNNSATLINNLNVRVQLMTTIGKGHEWMIPQLRKENIDTSKVFQVEHTGPISVIMEDPKITKIFVAPNLKENMNFEEVKIHKKDFENSKIVFFTPLADKYRKILEMIQDLNVISAVTVETQKIQNLEQLKETFTCKSNILFANLNDLGLIMGLDISDNSMEAIESRLIEIDALFSQYSECRTYTLGKYGAWIYVDGVERVNIPIIPIKAINRTGAGDAFAAGFLAKLHSEVSDVETFSSLSNSQKMEILIKCGKYATAAASLKVSTGKSPIKEEVDIVYKVNK